MTLLDQNQQTPPTTRRYRGLAVAATVLLISVLALTGYVLLLKRRAERGRAHATDSQHLAAPVAGPQTQIPIYVGSDADASLIQRQASAAMPADPGERAQQALRALISACTSAGSTHPLPQGADIRAVYIVGSNLAVIDLNSAFVDAHPSGILVEQLTIASLAQTVAANVPGITQVKFLVEGKERDTLAGHVSLRPQYDVATLATPLIQQASQPATSTQPH
jgi:hypothetical protein